MDLELSASDLKTIDEIVATYPHVGARYTETQLKQVNH